MAGRRKPGRNGAGAAVMSRPGTGRRVAQGSGEMERLLGEMVRMAAEHEKGDIDVRIPATEFSGDYRTIAEAVNGMVDGHIAVKKKTVACVEEFSKGNFDAPLLIQTQCSVRAG